ncbi:hypothetical protein PG991_015023 [Apiospora marii]|uniref:Uncharacterized protein n=1 Tax=Apiospora marii TaxID=335849 RepID=A0ABR1R2X9_9PEZI
MNGDDGQRDGPDGEQGDPLDRQRPRARLRTLALVPEVHGYRRSGVAEAGVGGDDYRERPCGVPFRKRRRQRPRRRGRWLWHGSADVEWRRRTGWVQGVLQDQALPGSVGGGAGGFGQEKRFLSLSLGHPEPGLHRVAGHHQHHQVLLPSLEAALARPDLGDGPIVPGAGGRVQGAQHILHVDPGLRRVILRETARHGDNAGVVADELEPVERDEAPEAAGDEDAVLRVPQLPGPRLDQPHRGAVLEALDLEVDGAERVVGHCRRDPRLEALGDEDVVPARVQGVLRERGQRVRPDPEIDAGALVLQE